MARHRGIGLPVIVRRAAPYVRAAASGGSTGGLLTLGRPARRRSAAARSAGARLKVVFVTHGGRP
ncbi:MAG TPA: hypothetical protein VFU43_21805 [Streptosporangiaceae bacterium]|nr:hypothetical protein [Streptosporangiaceae bacterium]